MCNLAVNFFVADPFGSHHCVNSSVDNPTREQVLKAFNFLKKDKRNDVVVIFSYPDAYGAGYVNYNFERQFKDWDADTITVKKYVTNARGFEVSSDDSETLSTAAARRLLLKVSDADRMEEIA